MGREKSHGAQPPDEDMQAIDDYSEKENFLPTVVEPFVGMLLKDQFLSSEDCQPFQERLPPRAGGSKSGSPDPM